MMKKYPSVGVWTGYNERELDSSHWWEMSVGLKMSTNVVYLKPKTR